MRLPRAGARPWVIAHRGASEDQPENTLAAFDAAVRAGCDAIELDLQLTRDGVPVVWHDRTLSRAGGARRRICGLDHHDLNDLDAAHHRRDRKRRQRILTLDEVLGRYARELFLLLEIKTHEDTERHRELVERVAALLRRRRATRRALALCFDTEVLDAFSRTAPGVARVLNLRAPRRVGRGLQRRLATLTALSVDIRTLGSRFADDLRRIGCPLMTYTCNGPRQLRRAVGAGAIGVMSDRPAWLADAIDQARS